MLQHIDSSFHPLVLHASGCAEGHSKRSEFGTAGRTTNLAVGDGSRGLLLAEALNALGG